jgi:hypothetical protein
MQWTQYSCRTGRDGFQAANPLGGYASMEACRERA